MAKPVTEPEYAARLERQLLNMQLDLMANLKSAAGGLKELVNEDDLTFAEVSEVYLEKVLKLTEEYMVGIRYIKTGDL